MFHISPYRRAHLKVRQIPKLSIILLGWDFLEKWLPKQFRNMVRALYRFISTPVFTLTVSIITPYNIAFMEYAGEENTDSILETLLTYSVRTYPHLPMLLWTLILGDIDNLGFQLGSL